MTQNLMSGVIRIMAKRDKYKEYLLHAISDKAKYEYNLAKMILSLIGKYNDCQVFTVGYRNRLYPYMELYHDGKRWRKIWHYPSTADFLRACDEVYVSEDMFFNVDGYDYDVERFNRIFTMWGYTMEHYERYVMQYEANHGKQDI